MSTPSTKSSPCNWLSDCNWLVDSLSTILVSRQDLQGCGLVYFSLIPSFGGVSLCLWHTAIWGQVHSMCPVHYFAQRSTNVWLGGGYFTPTEGASTGFPRLVGLEVVSSLLLKELQHVLSLQLAGLEVVTSLLLQELQQLGTLQWSGGQIESRSET